MCYTDAYSFIVYIKTDDIYKDIVEVLEARLGNLNYELDKPLSKEKKKSNGINERWIKRKKPMTKFARLRAKTYGYLKDDGSEDKKQKAQNSVSLKKN